MSYTTLRHYDTTYDATTLRHYNTTLDVFTRKATISEQNSLKTFFYAVRTFARIRQHYFSKYWEDGCMGSPPTSNLGGPSPQSPLGLRPGLFAKPDAVRCAV